jgi:hypothetical protein
MSDVGMRPGPRKSDQREMTGTGDITVPAIPEWVKDWGCFVLVPAALATLWAIGHIGHVYGAGLGWALLVTAVCGTLAVWWLGCSQVAREAHRLKATCRDRALTDVTSGPGYLAPPPPGGGGFDPAGPLPRPNFRTPTATPAIMSRRPVGVLAASVTSLIAGPIMPTPITWV